MIKIWYDLIGGAFVCLKILCLMGTSVCRRAALATRKTRSVCNKSYVYWHGLLLVLLNKTMSWI